MPSKTKPKEISHPLGKNAEALEWIAPGRPFEKKSRQYYLTALLIMLLVEAILFLFSEFMLMFVVAALVFVTFALASIPPKDFKYRISGEGVQIEDRFYLWQELYDFYFYKKYNYSAIHIRTKDLIPGELIITMGNQPEESIKKALISYLPFREYVKPSFEDRVATWLVKNFPLDSK
jgi:hypothetical protein